MIQEFLIFSEGEKMSRSQEAAMKRAVLSVAALSLIQSKFNLIRNRDLSFVREYLVENDGVSVDDALAMEEEYKRFIAMSFAVTKGLNIPVSASVDPFWHTHIMFTHDYTKMCHTLGGDYIHHVPATTKADRDRLACAYTENTLPIYEQAFGAPPKRWWLEPLAICVVCCDRDHHMEIPKVVLTV